MMKKMSLMKIFKNACFFKKNVVILHCYKKVI